MSPKQCRVSLSTATGVKMKQVESREVGAAREEKMKAQKREAQQSYMGKRAGRCRGGCVER